MKTPWHLWAIGAVSLLWNAGGAFDYVMSRFGVGFYTEQMTPEQLAYLDGFPFLVSIGWGLGVWGAVLGSILLLLRSRFATHAFVLSLAGMLANSVYGLFIAATPMTEIAGPGALAFTAAIAIVAIVLVVYSRAMAARGILG